MCTFSDNKPKTSRLSHDKKKTLEIHQKINNEQDSNTRPDTPTKDVENIDSTNKGRDLLLANKPKIDLQGKDAAKDPEAQKGAKSRQS